MTILSLLRPLRRPLLGLLLVPFTFAGCKGSDSPSASSAPPTQKLYVESNAREGNSVLAFTRASDGSLTVAGTYPSGGTGSPNPDQILGPQDNDRPMTVSADGKTLYAVNSGSNTVTAFNVASDGTLTAGSPVSSGGINPVSVGLVQSRLYVVNKNQDPAQGVQGALPNYAVLAADGGTLSPLPGTTFETGAAASPSFALPSRDGKFLFGTDFLAFMKGAGTLRSFTFASSGALAPAPGTPLTVPAGSAPSGGGALGLAQHPSQNVLYVGFPMKGAVGVYGIDPSSGALTYQTEVAAGRAACWLRINGAGTRLYVLNSADGAVQVFDTSNASSPASLQVLALKAPGPLFDAGPPVGMVPTSQPFHEELSADGQYLYVLNQHGNKDTTVANGNLLHVLKVAADGTLTEPSEPTALGVMPPNRPQGIVVY